MSDLVFSRVDQQLGEFTARGVDPITDLPLLHRWLVHPKSAFWMMQGAEFADVERMFQGIAQAPGRGAFLGSYRGDPAFLVETYDPATDLAEMYRPEPGDIGMHFLVAPTEEPLHGFTLAVLRTVMELLFEDLSTERVVVEPDIRNRPVHALNEAVGFHVRKTVSLRDKDAYLSTCTRDQYMAARHDTKNPMEAGR